VSTRPKHHVPKVDTYDDYDFMCGTHAFGATVDARDLCAPCVKKTLEIVDLLAEAHDVLSACEAPTAQLRRVRQKLLKRIDGALGKRATVAYATTETP
jgi:hypothetical protein